jgi:hypothetical protein
VPEHRPERMLGEPGQPPHTARRVRSRRAARCPAPTARKTMTVSAAPFCGLRYASSRPAA